MVMRQDTILSEYGKNYIKKQFKYKYVNKSLALIF